MLCKVLLTGSRDEMVWVGVDGGLLVRVAAVVVSHVDPGILREGMYRELDTQRYRLF